MDVCSVGLLQSARASMTCKASDRGGVQKKLLDTEFSRGNTNTSAMDQHSDGHGLIQNNHMFFVVLHPHPFSAPPPPHHHRHHHQHHQTHDHDHGDESSPLFQPENPYIFSRRSFLFNFWTWTWPKVIPGLADDDFGFHYVQVDAPERDAVGGYARETQQETSDAGTQWRSLVRWVWFDILMNVRIDLFL